MLLKIGAHSNNCSRDLFDFCTFKLRLKIICCFLNPDRLIRTWNCNLTASGQPF